MDLFDCNFYRPLPQGLNACLNVFVLLFSKMVQTHFFLDSIFIKKLSIKHKRKIFGNFFDGPKLKPAKYSCQFCVWT